MEPRAKALSSPLGTWAPGECVGSVTQGLWRPWGGGESGPGAQGGRGSRSQAQPRPSAFGSPRGRRAPRPGAPVAPRSGKGKPTRLSPGTAGGLAGLRVCSRRAMRGGGPRVGDVLAPRIHPHAAPSPAALLGRPGALEELGKGGRGWKGRNARLRLPALLAWAALRSTEAVCMKPRVIAMFLPDPVRCSRAGLKDTANKTEATRAPRQRPFPIDITLRPSLALAGWTVSLPRVRF